MVPLVRAVQQQQVIIEKQQQENAELKTLVNDMLKRSEKLEKKFRISEFFSTQGHREHRGYPVSLC